MSPRLRKSRLALILGGLLLIILVIVVINVRLAMRPEAVEARVRSILGDYLSAPFEIDSAELDLSRGVLLSGLRISEPRRREGEERRLLEFPRIRIVPDYGKLFFGSFEPALVFFEGGEIDAIVGEDGILNLSELLREDPSARSRAKPDAGSGGPPPRLPAFRLRGLRVRYADKRSGLALAAEDLDLSLSSSEAGVLLATAAFRIEGAARVEASGRLPGGIALLEEGPLDVDFSVYKLDPAGKLASVLDEKIGKLVKERSFSGSLDLEGALRYEGKSGLRVTRLAANLAGCGLVVPGVERPLRLTAGSIEFLGDRLELHEVRGQIAGGVLSASGNVGLDLANGSVTTLKGSLRVDSLLVDGELLAALAPGIDRSYPGIDIRGRVGLVCEAAREVKYPPALETLSARVELTDFQITHEDLPYPVEKLSGVLELDKGLLKVGETLTGKVGTARLAISEVKLALGGDGASDVVIDIGGKDPVECLALDGRLRGILDEEAVKVWDGLSPSGWVAAKARVNWPPAPGEGEEALEPYVILSVYPRELKISYRGFPYAVERISGEAVYDSRRRSIDTLDLEGWHGERKIVCKGSSVLGEKLDLSISCDKLEYDKDIRAALKPEVAELIDTFAFKGGFKTNVVISTGEDGELRARTVLDLLAGEIRPVDFPYRLRLATGRIVLEDRQRVDFSGFQTTAGQGPQVSFDGNLRSREGSRRLEYSLRLKDFELEKNFREAFPPQLQNLIGGLGLQGAFSGRLSGWYLKDLDDPANSKTYFEGTEIRTKNAAVNFGVKVSGMDAQGRFTGGHSRERPNHFWGEVKVERARFNRLQLTDGDILFAFGEPHDRIRRLVDNAEVPGEKGPYLSSSIISRLSKGDVSDTFQMSIASPNFYRGRLDGMLYVDTGEKVGDLGGEFAASGIQLSEASGDVFGLVDNGIGGEASGKVFFAGKTGDQRSIRGEGYGSIKDGELAQLPLFLGIFKLFKIPNLINLGFSDLFTRSKIDTLSIPYTIEDGRFLTKKLEMKSSNSALSFSGTGSMDFDGNLALELEPQLPSTRLKLPLLPELIDLTGIDVENILGFIKKGILKIKVGGDVARPKVELATGLGLLKVPLPAGTPGKKPPAEKKQAKE